MDPLRHTTQEHLFLVCELLRANLYEFQKYNRESGDAPYFTNACIQRIARQVGSTDDLHHHQVVRCCTSEKVCARCPGVILKKTSTPLTGWCSLPLPMLRAIANVAEPSLCLNSEGNRCVLYVHVLSG